MKQVEIKIEVKETDTLLKYLLINVKNKSKNNIKSLLKNGNVYVNGKIITKHDYIIKNGDILNIKLTQLNSTINVLYEDKYLIAVEKPYGLLTISTEKEKTNTLYHMVSDYLKDNGNSKVFIVHRLDKDTSGVVLFAKDMSTKLILQDNWDDIVSVKKYVAVVEGITEKSGTIKSYLKENSEHIVYSSTEGKLAITDYKVIKQNRCYSFLEVDLKTGRKNQIRVQMNDIGHPILGDKKYGSNINPINRVALHAYKLEFRHPITNKTIILTSEIPALFKMLFNV